MTVEVGGLVEVMSWVMDGSEVVSQGACFELSALPAPSNAEHIQQGQIYHVQ